MSTISSEGKGPSRLVMYNTDIMRIESCSMRHANTTIAEIISLRPKRTRTRLTIKEYCKYSGFAPEDVYLFLD
jgi:hypothetical protein